MYSFLVLSTLLTCYVSASVFRNEIMNHENWNLIPSTNCGMNKHPERIFKGDVAKYAQFPWIAQIFGTKKVDRFLCGGALINDRYVVTAAHCVYGNEKRIKRVRLGDYLAKYERSICLGCEPKTYKVESITVHPEFSEDHFINDIALIRLDEPVVYNAVIRPICLPRNDVLDETFVGEKVDIAGWGKESSEDYPSLLKYVTLPIRDKCVCNEEYETKLHDGQICVGVMSGADTCDGDSGGPLVWNRKEGFFIRNYIVGIVSYGKDNCGEGPGVYTNLVHYMKWILDNIYDEHESSETDSNDTEDNLLT